MQPVVAEPFVSPDEIENLHEAMQALMPPRSDVFQPARKFPTRDSLIQLAREVGMEGIYKGARTCDAVEHFKLQEGLCREEDRRSVRQRVDRPTRDKLNDYLRDAGAFDDPDQRTVLGIVRFAATAGNPATPAPGIPVAVFDESGSRTVVFATGVSAADGSYRLPFPFREGQQRWVGVPDASGYRPKVSLARGMDPRITVDLDVLAAGGSQSFNVSGVVKRPQPGTAGGVAVQGVAVSAYVVSEGNRKLLPPAVTDATGAYAIATAARAGAELMVAVEDANGVFVARSMSWINAGLDVTRDLVLPAASGAGDWVVKGRVTGRSLPANLVVQAFDRDIRSEQLLGQCTPDAQGYYEIHYLRSDFERVDRPDKGPEPLLRVYSGATELPVRATSSAGPFNAPRLTEIHLEVIDRAYEALSEYERHLADIEPVRDGVALADFTEDDITFVAGETEIERQHVAWLARAASLHAGAPPAVVPAEAYYGWFREGVSDDPQVLKGTPIPKLQSKLLAAIDDGFVPAWLEQDIDEILGLVPSPRRDELTGFLMPLQLSGGAATTVAQVAGEVGAIPNVLVATLVSNASVNDQQGHAIGLSASLHGLLDRDAAAAGQVRDFVFDGVVGGKLQQALDLAKPGVADWVLALGASGITLPGGATLESYADQLSRNVARTFPTESMLYAVCDTRGVKEAWTDPGMQALRPRNPAPLEHAWGELDTSQVDPRALDRVRQGHAFLVAFCNLHPGLALRAMFHGEPDAAAGTAAVVTRVGLLQMVQHLNQPTTADPGIDLLRVDYLAGSTSLAEVKFGSLSAGDQKAVTDSLKVYQRLQTVTENPAGTVALLKAGYQSATAVAQATASQIAARAGIDAAEAALYQGRAQRQSQRASLRWFSMHVAARDAQRLGPQRAFAALPSNQFAEIPGYAQLFGRLAACDCDPCTSVLSPAAYFVDLMYFAEKQIHGRPYLLASDGYDLPGGLPVDHALHLKKRRPDLWELGLTCDNAEDVIPTLDVVNKVLLQAVDPANAGTPALAFRALALRDQTPRQPAHWALERLEVLLGHFEVDRSAIASALDLAAEARTRARLGLSLKAAKMLLDDMLVDPAVAAARFTPWVEIGALPSDPDTELQGVDPASLMRAVGLTHDEVVTIALTTFVSAVGPQAPVILTGHTSSGGVQNDSETLDHLSLRRLDRFECFVRLWLRLSWTVAELDHVLGVVAGAGARLDQHGLDVVARLVALQGRWDLPVDEACALWSGLPSRGLRGDESLWDRRFNLPQFVQGTGGRWPAAQDILFVPAALSDVGQASPADSTQQRLRAALQTSDAQLVALVVGLARAMEPPQPDPKAGVVLNEANLALLYRHARLARLLGIEPEALFALLKSAGLPAVKSEGDLQALLSAWDAVTASGFGLAEVRRVCDPQESSQDALAERVQQDIAAGNPFVFGADVFTQAGIGDAASRAVVAGNLSTLLEPAPGSSIYRLLQGQDPEDASARLKFDDVSDEEVIAASTRAILQVVTGGPFAADALLSAGLVTAEAGDLIAINVQAGAIEVVPGRPDRFRLTVGGSQLLKLAPDAAGVLRLASAALQRRGLAVLARYHWRSVLRAKLGSAMGLTADRCAALYRMAVKVFASLEAGLEAALLGGSTQALSTLLDRVTRLALLYRAAVFDADTLDFIAGHAAEFGLVPDLAFKLGMGAVTAAAAYAALASPADPAYASGEAVQPADPAALQVLLSSAVAPADWPIGSLAAALRTSPSRIATLRKAVPAAALGAGGLDALYRLRQALDVADRFGLNPEVLQLAVWQAQFKVEEDFGAEFDQLVRAGDAVLSLFRTVYADGDRYQAMLEPFEDKLRSRQRDMLVEFLTHDYANADRRERFKSADDLYAYYLLDVQVEGCSRTSRLVSAISSVQLYVQRALLRLERTAAEVDKPSLVIGFEPGSDGALSAAEWEWRKNFRLWQANRKVFLYPESYLEPGLRDDKTPLFRQLEDTLLQQDITEQNVLDAYAQYLAGFEEIASLRVAGACHDRRNGRDTLHLFGVTASDPPAHYYRAIDDLDHESSTRFGHWQKLDVAIPSRSVSPVVADGRLYVFWMETTTRPLQEFKDGQSAFRGYRHTVRVRYTNLRLDGRWSAAEVLRVRRGSEVHDSRTIDDLFPQGTLVLPWLPQEFKYPLPPHPPWDTAEPSRLHTEPLEAYHPTGWRWAMPFASVTTYASGDDQIFIGIGPASAPNDPRLSAIELVDIADRLTSAVANVPTASLTSFLRRQRKPTGSADSVFLVASGTSVPRLPYYEATWHIQTVSADAAITAAPTLRPRDSDLPEWPDPPEPVDPPGVDPTDPRVRTPLLSIPPDAVVSVLIGDEQSALIETGGDTVLLRDLEAQAGQGARYALRRMGTMVASDLRRTLATGGIGALLSLDTQSAQLREPPAPVVIDDANVVSSNIGNPANPNDALRMRPYAKDAPLATYIREIYFHIPFLIADHLNSRGKFGDAQRWYHRIFDPTAAAPPDESEAVRPWRYLEFRQPIEPLAESLSDSGALEAYRHDPFNPHAVARLRPGAYQKAVVMKYIDNLLDWGDSLFAQFTMESVNEATMLYMLASTVLGQRPLSAGPCGEVAAKDNTTYTTLHDDLSRDHEVLVQELEGLEYRFPVAVGWRAHVLEYMPTIVTDFRFFEAPVARAAVAAAAQGGSPTSLSAAAWNRASPVVLAGTDGTPLADATLGRQLGSATLPSVGVAAGRSVAPSDPIGSAVGASFGILDPRRQVGLGSHVKTVDLAVGPNTNVPLQLLPPHDLRVLPQLDLDLLARASVVFCLPDNADLTAYWDRVESRLYRIRNCMDIAGVRRPLALFAPEIDPHLLVRMKAAGLSTEDVLDATRGKVPPYRFQFLIEKARQYAGVVQGFGSQLLSALEKRDAEQLAVLRTAHEQNALQLRNSMVRWQVDAAQDALDALNEKKASAVYRRDYYDGLVQVGLSPWEITEAAATHLTGAALLLPSVMYAVASVAALFPNAGAPTAMTYGGRELSDWAARAGEAQDIAARIGEVASKSAAIEATFQRRADEWRHQSTLATREIAQLAKEIAAAELQRDIQQQAQTVHERDVEHAQDIYDFMRDRFTSFGRYTWLAEQMQRLHRMAFDAALSMARLAEEAYRFERPEQAAEPLLTGNYWDSASAGLLAGDRLSLDLQGMERRFLETNDRLLEVEQAFSLQQLNPSALLKLRHTGACTFSISPLALDLAYPGHYRRRIRAIRLTLPCVVGPYVNLGATLSLTKSSMRMSPTDRSDTPVPARHTTTVAMSTAQNDGGVFEFGFRDERYMPFEGAGVVSDWALRLPQAVRPFDYSTISDVVVRIAYTALASDELRDTVEDLASNSALSLRALLANPGVSRVFSLRDEFPDVWAALVNSPPGTEVAVPLTAERLPYFASTFELEDAPLDLLLDLNGPSGTGAVFGVKRAGEAVWERVPPSSGGFVPDGTSGLPGAASKVAPVTGALALRVDNAGDLAPARSAGATAASVTLDSRRVRDVLLRMTLRRKTRG